MSTLTISIEVELGWGVHDIRKSSHLSEDGKEERKYLDKIIEKSEEIDIPISFDIVGHLLLSECDGNHDGPYPEGWFQADSGTDKRSDPLFYAPDIANKVLGSNANHELCTHTFSHILCDDASNELIEKELQQIQELHQHLHNEVVRSFVPPRHRQPSNRTLKQNGIKVARYAKENKTLTPLHRLKQLTIGPHPMWEPKFSDGILETYCTRYPSLTAGTLPAGQSSKIHPVFRPIPVSLRKKIHLQYLKKSTKRAFLSGTPLHLWCHLYDLSNEHQWEVIDKYFDYLDGIQESDLMIKTMSELPDMYE
ncbi:hypothetical protein SAMN05216388_103325 [Halorientalis persicus]|uniref:NodB homology domain-containing protein n=1 Tax=Halorientalis persicus TaxID=1367881 RepID=A0A1H8V5S0_9EURY|nr:polysaccharide deacetylase family protein [Halorientalis persicus]SEP10603.1 hypothetical protein SAMN05216388_103325 [Halorientalis persicus]